MSWSRPPPPGPLPKPKPGSTRVGISTPRTMVPTSAGTPISAADRQTTVLPELDPTLPPESRDTPRVQRAVAFRPWATKMPR